MATLKTGDFSLRALPRVPQINPANFDARIGDLINTFGSAMQLPAQLERVRSIQRAGELERATQGQTIELAKQRAAQELELGPYRAAAEKRKSTATLDQPGGDNLYYDEAGNLVKETVTIETDPITGEQFNVSVPSIIKTARQVEQDRINAEALNQLRVANTGAAISNAQTRRMDAETRKARLQQIRSGGGRMSFYKDSEFGITTGYTAFRAKPGGGFTAIRLDANLNPTGQTFDTDALPDGEAVDPETDQTVAKPFKIDMPAESPASVPAVPVTAAPAGQSPSPPTPVAPVAPVGAGPVQIRNEAEYQALPSGTQYVDPNGVVRTKK